MRKSGWIVMTVFASLVAAYALVQLVVPGAAPPFMVERRMLIPWAVAAHLAGGFWAMAVGPWQFSERHRARALARHRWLGRSYVVAILVGGVGALALAPFAQTGRVAAVGFGALAVAWLGTTLAAWLRIRGGDRAAHRRWMIRSFALTLAAVTLRIYLPTAGVLGIPFHLSYPAIAWLCWVPNLLVAEVILSRRTTGAVAAA